MRDDVLGGVEGGHHKGVPLLDDRGNPIAGIGEIGAANRLTEERCHEEFAAILKAEANEIDLALRHA